MWIVAFLTGQSFTLESRESQQTKNIHILNNEFLFSVIMSITQSWVPSAMAYYGSCHTSCSHTPVIRDEQTSKPTAPSLAAAMCSLPEVCCNHESLTSCVLQVQTDIRVIWSINKSTDFIQGTCHIELMRMKTKLQDILHHVIFTTQLSNLF